MFVRVGGGFMDIYEFIRVYTPSEVEKIERKPGVTSKFAMKMALQKAATNVAEGGRETSPIRSPQRPSSPSPHQSPLRGRPGTYRK